MPTGGYAHSFGLERYCQAGLVRDRHGLERFLLTQLEGATGPCDATAAAARCARSPGATSRRVTASTRSSRP